MDAEFQSIRHGHCGGAMAIQRAHEDITTGRFEFCIAGGVDSHMHDKTLTWLDRSGQLQSSSRRSGMVPGEAAAFCLLCRPSVARALALPPLLAVSSASTAIEPHAIKRKGVCVGEGLAVAIRAATAGAPVDAVFCDINGQRYRNEEWGMASLRLSDVISDASRYEAPASILGDVGAASGPLFVALVQESIRRRYAHARRFLGWTSAEGGHRTAFVLESLVPKNKNAEVLP
ncbi:beta-ketoacyl synthase N-terminal-like domain-containing protein [Myxococcus sp. MxC21-1]|uniref:beta-ketoacyl synthase N-terminal-like domain-containing protein n=1 Tax=Myxococcus sp. MxC21-1 TaxID=3041439 RepID=UPI00292F35DD|nr:beta-ketoacyl synthase N-terminal-like domain-containing protein [Myxococcus sp. MxC21-1]WNZ61370.1 beta-ketoacyl synthase N-terminal-like domain-containing protein [Myxococcus sp. MxC21-1]